ncbi:putative tudor domain-containing protein 5 [Kosakonia phage Kc263]|uniref:Tudor domain-containing protein 5 n=1 Tax=Kosakonia phage Kc263 TaxID=2863194 RepID=A0AAE8BGK3_9CAUD|nr:putative tudor domain-containing protein 5 [Kosakonia phage Kc263]QYN80077.1 putative tudor domain-containing protein 5 [Kosakonia phage Kc263]
MQINKPTIQALAKAIKGNAKFINGPAYDDQSWVDLGNNAILVKKVLTYQTVTDLFIHGVSIGTISDTRDLNDLEDRLKELFTLLAKSVAYQHAQNITAECKEFNWDFNKYGFKVLKKTIEIGPIDIWTVCFNDQLMVQLPFHVQDQLNAELMIGQSIRAIVLDKCFGEGFIFEILPGEIHIRNMVD